jgi:hypothetical protein
MLPDLLTIIKMATSVTEGLKKIRPRQESRDGRVQDLVSRILRTLYFRPDGILSLLNEVAKGERPTDERIRQALIDFNDRQWKIEGATEGLEFDTLEKELGLSLNSIMILGSIREGKSDLRFAIQEEVNSYGQEGKSPNRARVRELIKAIGELNAAIEQVEAVINRRASSGHPQKLPSTRTLAKKSPKRATRHSRGPKKTI